MGAFFGHHTLAAAILHVCHVLDAILEHIAPDPGPSGEVLTLAMSDRSVQARWHCLSGSDVPQSESISNRRTGSRFELEDRMLDYATRPGAFAPGHKIYPLKPSPLSGAAVAAAAAAGFAMIARAFALHGPEAELRLLEGLRKERLLSDVWSEDVIAHFRSMVREWSADPAIAEEVAMEALALLRKHPETAAAVVRLSLRAAAPDAAPSLTQVRAIANLQLAAGVNRKR